MTPGKGKQKRQDACVRAGGERDGGKREAWLGVRNFSRKIQKNVMGTAQSIQRGIKAGRKAASWLGLDLSNFLYGPIFYGKYKQGPELLAVVDAGIRSKKDGKGLEGKIQVEQGLEAARPDRQKLHLSPHTGGVEGNMKGKNRVEKVVGDAGEVIRESILVEREARETLCLSDPDMREQRGSSVEAGAGHETQEISQAVPTENIQVVVSGTRVEAKLSVEVSGTQMQSNHSPTQDDMSPTPPEWKRVRPNEKGLPAAPSQSPPARKHAVSGSEIDDEASDATPGRIMYARRALDPPAAVDVAKKLVESVGARLSVELGIHLEEGDEEIDKWFLATMLFKNRLPCDNVLPVYQRLTGVGIRTMVDISDRESEELVSLLSKEGFSWKTSARLKRLARQLRGNFGSISVLKNITQVEEVEQKLQSFEGVGPVTCHLFLRELRGIWAANIQAYSTSAISAAHHLHLIAAGEGKVDNSQLSLVLNANNDRWQTQLDEIALAAGVDSRDLSVALSRLDGRHGRDYWSCSGGLHCRGYNKKKAH